MNNRYILMAVAILCVGLGSPAFGRGEDDGSQRKAVKVVADQAFLVTGEKGQGEARLFVTQDWSHPLPAVRRAIILIHGLHRNADSNRRAVAKLVKQGALPGEETLVIIPQFLIEADVTEHSLSPKTLWWTVSGWAAGEPAHSPAPVSAFDVLDAYLARLAEKDRFPALTQVVIAGHSAGGQVVQRYAIVGRGEAALTARGVHVRYVVANPSSYAYFDAQRPSGDGFAPFDHSECPRFNHWKYGMERLPRYARGQKPAELEASYVSRDVVYLLGTADIDPHHPELDVTCMGNAEGPYRLARGEAYAKYMVGRHPGLSHRVLLVPGVAHDSAAMFRSACGLAALLDKPGCDSK